MSFTTEQTKKILKVISRKYHNPTPQEITLHIIKGGMENEFHISFEDFIKEFNILKENYPEKLI